MTEKSFEEMVVLKRMKINSFFISIKFDRTVHFQSENDKNFQ